MSVAGPDLHFCYPTSSRIWLESEKIIGWMVYHCELITYCQIISSPYQQIHIQRTEGCDHMNCTQCNTNFCYRCGEKYRHLRFFGDHTSNLSVFGCKYRYLPEKPHLRRLVRGSICSELHKQRTQLWFIQFFWSTRSYFCKHNIGLSWAFLSIFVILMCFRCSAFQLFPIYKYFTVYIYIYIYVCVCVCFLLDSVTFGNYNSLTVFRYN